MKTSIGTRVCGSLADPVGTVFSDGQKIFRLISDDWVEHSLSLLKSGLIDKLVNEGLFPKTSISDIFIQDCSLVLEHERISFISYPYEWSPSMLKDAALLMIKVNKIAEKYGYYIGDGHGYNVLFKGTTPVFIDFGSFAKKQAGIESNIDEFIWFFLVPLTIFQEGDYYLAHKLILDGYFPGSRLLLGSKSSYLKQKANKYYICIISCFNLILFKSSGKIAASFFRKLAAKIKFIKVESSISFLEEKVSKFTWNKNFSAMWSDSQNQYLSSVIPYRFEKILQITKSLKNVYSSLDVAGNNAYLSLLLSKLSKFEKLISMDNDIFAVESSYLLAKKISMNINLIATSFIQLASNMDLVQRLKSDVVYGLELTHRLILSQGLKINTIFEVFNNVSNKYVFIEFMPLGLSLEDQDSNSPIPSWYTIEWFRDNFLCFFNLIEEIKIEKNRILFFGEKKNGY